MWGWVLQIPITPSTLSTKINLMAWNKYILLNFITDKFIPTFSISWRTKPVLTWMTFAGIKPYQINHKILGFLPFVFNCVPNRVPKKKYEKGIPTIGEEMFTNQFGTKGVIRRNSMYQNKLWMLSKTSKVNLSVEIKKMCYLFLKIYELIWKEMSHDSSSKSVRKPITSWSPKSCTLKPNNITKNI